MNPEYLITRQQGIDRIDRIDYNPDQPTLAIMEFFYNTIQGEGISIGISAAFLRLRGCLLDCAWCDTDWKKGNVYTFREIFLRMDDVGLIKQFREGTQTLVLTGGSPLMQQEKILKFLRAFGDQYNFVPRIEVENECVRMPLPELIELVDQWNNSPKLSSSGMKRSVRYKPEVIKYMSDLKNSWFKFVIECEEDWEEILMDFLDFGLIKREQVLLMPLAKNLEELHQNKAIVKRMSERFGIRYSTRKQLEISVP